MGKKAASKIGDILSSSSTFNAPFFANILAPKNYKAKM
jgi:hypothetical protein